MTYRSLLVISYSMELHVRLRQIREAMSLSQNEMALKAGVSASQIYLLESGKVGRFHGRTRRGIAKAYGIDPVTGAGVDENGNPITSGVSGGRKTKSDRLIQTSAA